MKLVNWITRQSFGWWYYTLVTFYIRNLQGFGQLSTWAKCSGWFAHTESEVILNNFLCSWTHVTAPLFLFDFLMV